MGKPSQLEKAIQELIAERDALDLAIFKLQSRLTEKPKRKAKAARPALVQDKQAG